MINPKTSIASYASSGALVISGMTANDFAVLLGMVLAILTFGINWYYKYKHLKIIEQKVNEMPFPKLNEEEV